MTTRLKRYLTPASVLAMAPRLILVYGLFLRLYTFLWNKSVWGDEMSLFHSLDQTSFSALHLPFSGSQGGAYLFNLIENAFLRLLTKSNILFFDSSGKNFLT